MPQDEAVVLVLHRAHILGRRILPARRGRAHGDVRVARRAAPERAPLPSPSAGPARALLHLRDDVPAARDHRLLGGPIPDGLRRRRRLPRRLRRLEQRLAARAQLALRALRDPRAAHRARAPNPPLVAHRHLGPVLGPGVRHGRYRGVLRLSLPRRGRDGRWAEGRHCVHLWYLGRRRCSLRRCLVLGLGSQVAHGGEVGLQGQVCGWRRGR